ncbi:MAG: TRAP transporter large permease [Burkholderiaceae bacterium]|nr:TRAP transporter large permease [Burkholderiaceae bacterium]
MATATLIGLLLLLLAIGVPVAFSMAVAGIAGLYLLGGASMVMGILSTTPLSTVSTYELLTIPMFILMAEIVIVSQIADELFDTMTVWVGRVRGGLAIATAFAGAGFGAISGSSTAGAATLASTSLPAMMRLGYERKLANGVVAISGTLAMLIPPSMAVILYALVADESVSQLLIAGLVPGLLVTLTIAATVYLLCLLDPSRAPPGRSYSWREKFVSLRVTGSMVVLMLLVTGVIYLGVATPTEAACLGAFGALCIALLRGRMSWQALFKALGGAARTSAMISMIIIGAHIFSYGLTITQTTQQFVGWVSSLPLDPYMIIALIVLLYLVLGCFLDQIAILILTVPILLPVVKALGFDGVWFGIILILTAEVGMVTPPVGMNAFVVARYTGRPVHEVFAGVLPHVVAHVLLIALLVAFPAIVMWLPSTMLK